MDQSAPARNELRGVLYRGAIVIAIIAALCGILSLGPGDAVRGGSGAPFPVPADKDVIRRQSTSANAAPSKGGHRDHGGPKHSDWVLVNRIDGIETYKGHTKVKDMHSFLGNTTVPMHISQILGPFINISLAPDWIHMLKTLVQLDCVGVSCGSDPQRTSVVYQLFDSPWPVSDRDLVLLRSWDADEHTKTIIVEFRSIDDSRLPEIDGVVRAVSPLTLWKFQQKYVQSQGRSIAATYIEVQSTVDIRGSIPTSLYNYMQSRYAHMIISSLINIAARNVTAPVAQFSNW